jgi:hypothetical protein
VHRHGSPARNVEKAHDAVALSRSRRRRFGGDVGILMGLQRSAGNAAVVHAVQAARQDATHSEAAVESSPIQRSTVHDVLRSAGRPLDAGVRSDMQARLGADFSGVRIHTGSAAHRSAVEIGAEAHTSGEHVVLGNGAGDRHTRAHELTHVVQQRQGPVPGTDRGDGLRVSDPDDRHERAAEADAHQALQRRPADLSAPGPVARHDQVVAAPDHLVVQRKVGFEFETPWRARRVSTGRSLGKRELIGTAFDGFKVEADADPGGEHSEIEFIVDPPVEEGDAGERRLVGVMRGLTRVGEQMEDASRKPDQERDLFDDDEERPLRPEDQVRFFRQDKATGRVRDNDFAIIPRGKLRAAAQVTSGFKLRALPRLGETLAPRRPDLSNVGDMGDMAEFGYLADSIDGGNGGAQAGPQAFDLPAAMAPGAATLRGRAAQVHGTAALPNPSDALKGLISIVASYLVQGSANLPLAYPKTLGNLLLARTDFAKLFRLLPQEERATLKADPRIWIELVVEAASRGNASLFRGRIEPDARVLKAGTDRTEKRVDLTIRDWLTAIPQNQDLLTRIEGSQSMGAMGSKVEGVGRSGAREEAGIFEFRASQGVNLSLREWSDFALGAQRYITRLHEG